MTDEELAEVLMREYDAKPPTWTRDDELPDLRCEPRVRAHWRSVVWRTRDLIESSQRERTAATLLAALIQERALRGGQRDPDGLRDAHAAAGSRHRACADSRG